MEIVTWVLSGRLEHKDSEGNHGEIYPGLAQRMSAGTGIWHSEMNPSAGEDVHFVQMWVLPDTEAVDPGYEQSDINAELDRGGLVPIASGQGHDGAISVRQRDAVLWGGRLRPGEAVDVPDARHAHLYVAGRRRGPGGRRTARHWRRRPVDRCRQPAAHRRARRRRGPHLGDRVGRLARAEPHAETPPDCPSETGVPLQPDRVAYGRVGYSPSSSEPSS